MCIKPHKEGTCAECGRPTEKRLEPGHFKHYLFCEDCMRDDEVNLMDMTTKELLQMFGLLEDE